MTSRVNWPVLLLALALVSGAVRSGAQDAADKRKADAKRPTLSLKASPAQAMSTPVRISLTGDLRGGPDDAEEYYCPAVEWSWGDGTVSESSADCDPYEAGKSTIQRRYAIQHIFRMAGRYQIQLRLKKKDKTIATATASVRVFGTFGDSGP
jgi:hypothetical protein